MWLYNKLFKSCHFELQTQTKIRFRKKADFCLYYSLFTIHYSGTTGNPLRAHVRNEKVALLPYKRRG